MRRIPSWWLALACLGGCTAPTAPADGGPDASTFDAGPLIDDVPDSAPPGGDAPSLDGRPTDAPSDTRADPSLDAPVLPDTPPTDVDAPGDTRDAGPPGCGRPLIAECSEPSLYDAPCSSRELHLIGHYQPGVPMVTVLVERTGAPITLSLNSYAATTWSVETAPGVELEQIVVDGFEAHTVLAPPGIPVVNRSGTVSSVACAVEWPFDTGGCDTEGLVTSLFSLTGLRPNSFIGCYEGTGYRLGN